MKKFNLISSFCVLTLCILVFSPEDGYTDDRLRIKRLSQKVKELKDINDDMDKRLSRMRDEMKDRSEKNRELQEEIENLSQQKISLGQTLDLANQKIRAQEKIVAKYTSQLEEQADDFEKNLQGDLLEAIKRNRETEASIPGLIEAVRKPLQQRITRLQKEIASANMAAEEAKSRMSLAEQEKDGAEQELKQFQLANEKLNDNFKDVNQRLEEQVSINNTITKKMGNIEEKNKFQEERIASLTQQNKKINSELSARKDRVEELTKIKDRNDFLEQKIAMYAEREQNMSQIRVELEQIQKPLLEEITRLESEVSRLNNVLTQKDTAIQVLRNKTWDKASSSQQQGEQTVEDLMAVRNELDKAVKLIVEKNGR